MIDMGLWYEAEFVFDANILLNLIRFFPDASDKLEGIIANLSDRIWIPRQFYDEYRKNLPKVRQDIKKEYINSRNNFEGLHNKQIDLLNHFGKRTRFEIRPQIVELLQLVNTMFSEDISTFWQERKIRLRDDDIENRIEQLFAGKVGPPLPDSRRADIPAIWQWRLDQNIPPGLKDKKKTEPRRYGDLIGWLQIIDRAHDEGRPVIMVTDDTKEGDWFWTQNGTPHGSRPELVQEMYGEASVDFYIYTSEQFIRLASAYLKQRAIATTMGEYFRSHTPTFLPGFAKSAAFQGISTLTSEWNTFSGSWRHALYPTLRLSIVDHSLISSLNTFGLSHKIDLAARFGNKGMESISSAAIANLRLESISVRAIANLGLESSAARAIANMELESSAARAIAKLGLGSSAAGVFANMRLESIAADIMTISSPTKLPFSASVLDIYAGIASGAAKRNADLFAGVASAAAKRNAELFTGAASATANVNANLFAGVASAVAKRNAELFAGVASTAATRNADLFAGVAAAATKRNMGLSARIERDIYTQAVDSATNHDDEHYISSDDVNPNP